MQQRNVLFDATAFAGAVMILFNVAGCTERECRTDGDCGERQICDLEGTCFDVDNDRDRIAEPPVSFPGAEIDLGFPQESRILVPPGDDLWLVQSEGRLARVDAVSGAFQDAIVLDGRAARGRLLDAHRAVVSYADRRAVDIVDLDSGQVTRRPLPGPASATAVFEERLFVAVPALREVLELHSSTGEIVHTYPLPGIPTSMETSPDGKVTVAFLNDGVTLDIDPDDETPPERTEWVPPGTPVRRVGPLIYAGPSLISSFEERVTETTTTTTEVCTGFYYTAPPSTPPCPPNAPLQILQSESTEQILRTVFARQTVQGAETSQTSTRARPQRNATPLLVRQVAVAFGGRLRMVLDEGGASVLLFSGRSVDAVSPLAFARLQIDAGSTDLALSRDADNIFVYNETERSLMAFRMPTPTLRAPDGKEAHTLSTRRYRSVVTDAPLSARVRRGAQRFVESSTRVSVTEQFSCASCHPGGGNDGMIWGSQTTIPLLSRADTAPFHWNNDAMTPSDINDITIKGRMGGTGLAPSELTDLFAYVDTLEAPLGLMPEREDVQRGADLFFSSTLGCTQCHWGEKLTDGELHVIDGFGVPTATPPLVGLAYTAPYLSDGSAQTLRDVINMTVVNDRMGQGSTLEPEDVDDLVAFLRSR